MCCLCKFNYTQIPHFLCFLLRLALRYPFEVNRLNLRKCPTDDGKPQYWAIDNYFITGERNTHFLGCDVVKQHHTLTQIIMGLLNNGFELKVVEEAEPPKEMMDIPGMEDELRRPMMLLVKAIAKK